MTNLSKKIYVLVPIFVSYYAQKRENNYIYLFVIVSIIYSEYQLPFVLRHHVQCYQTSHIYTLQHLYASQKGAILAQHAKDGVGQVFAIRHAQVL